MGGTFDPKYRCTSKAKSTGNRCQRRAAPGCEVCVIHGGAAPQVREAGRRRLLLAEHAALIGDLLAEIGAEEADPQRDLAEALAYARQMRLVYARLVTELSTAPGAEGIFGPDHNGDAKSHVLVVELHRWTETQAKLSKLALDVGLDERRVQAEEAKVTLVERALMAALAELDVPMDKAGPVVARHLRSVPAA
ncbi:MAG TPA: hypothetical protein VGW74_10615 [Propionibacteriaceae bacterium]|nr:hypothetical protein [Propionibacteriaceae bacterium]